MLHPDLILPFIIPDIIKITYNRETILRVPSGLPIKCGISSLKMWEFNIALNPM